LECFIADSGSVLTDKQFLVLLMTYSITQLGFCKRPLVIVYRISLFDALKLYVKHPNFEFLVPEIIMRLNM